MRAEVGAAQLDEVLEPGQERLRGPRVVGEVLAAQRAVGRPGVREPLEPLPVRARALRRHGREHELRRRVQARELDQHAARDGVDRGARPRDPERAVGPQARDDRDAGDRGALRVQLLELVPVLRQRVVLVRLLELRACGRGAEPDPDGEERVVLRAVRPQQAAEAPHRVDRVGHRGRLGEPHRALDRVRAVDRVAHRDDGGLELLALRLELAPRLHLLVEVVAEHEDRAEPDEDDRQDVARDGVEDHAHEERRDHREVGETLRLRRLRRLGRAQLALAEAGHDARGPVELHDGARRREARRAVQRDDRDHGRADGHGVRGRERRAQHALTAHDQAVRGVRVRDLDRLADRDARVPLRHLRVAQADVHVAVASEVARADGQRELAPRVGSLQHAQHGDRGPTVLPGRVELLGDPHDRDGRPRAQARLDEVARRRQHAALAAARRRRPDLQREPVRDGGARARRVAREQRLGDVAHRRRRVGRDGDVRRAGVGAVQRELDSHGSSSFGSGWSAADGERSTGATDRNARRALAGAGRLSRRRSGRAGAGRPPSRGATPRRTRRGARGGSSRARRARRAGP